MKRTKQKDSCKLTLSEAALRKCLLSCVLVMVLITPASYCANASQNGKPAVTAPQGNKKNATKPGNETSALKETQFQPWGPTACRTLHPGPLPTGRRKSVRFVYTLHRISGDAPAGIQKAQPFYLVPDADNPFKLYAGQELVVEISYDLATPATGASAAEVLANARKMVDAEVPLITIDIESSSATAINPAPVRQGQSSFSIEGNKAEPIKTVYACGYKQPLVGDTVPTVSVTALVKDVSQPLILIQTSLPQVHTLAYFNVATGVVGSTIRDTSFNRVEFAPASGSTPEQFKTVSQRGDPRVLPVLIFTAYLWHPIDAEAPFERMDLIPQPSIGFSLTSPSGDFFFGGSSEFFKRNVQLTYGYHYGQTTHLVPGQTTDPTSSAAPQTVKRFDSGTYVGLTFNIDFVKGLFSGGGSKSP